MIHMTSHDIVLLLNASATKSTNLPFTGMSIDTRSLNAGNLFIAITGAHLDGHDFVQTAYEKGAALALVSRKIDCPIPQIIVNNTTLAMGQIAAHWRAQFTLPVIAITGSNGKTTVKNMIAAILLAHCKQHPESVLFTQGNLNNHWGVPLTLATLDHTHQYAVIEMGMNHFGEIDYLTHLASPTVALITHAGAAHLEGVGNTIAGVAKAKAEIFAGLTANGTAILNRDDDFYSFWQTTARAFKQISFGLNSNADVNATILQLGNAQQLLVNTPTSPCEIKLPLLGEHNAKNALAAVAAGLTLNIPLQAIVEGLSTMQPEKGRLCLSTLASGTTLIDDTYNANPTSFAAAIDTLAHSNDHTILVMGDMKELGQNAYVLHEHIGQKAKKAGITRLFTMGQLSKAASLAFGNDAAHFSTHDALCEVVKNYCTANTTILVKGSRSMQMEKVVQFLHQHALHQ